jgi:hypothetical protein
MPNVTPEIFPSKFNRIDGGIGPSEGLIEGFAQGGDAQNPAAITDDRPLFRLRPGMEDDRALGRCGV